MNGMIKDSESYKNLIMTMEEDYIVNEVVNEITPILAKYIHETYESGKNDYIREAKANIILKAWEDALASCKIDVSKTFKDKLVKYLQDYKNSEHLNAIDYINACASEIIGLVTLELINNGYIITKK